MGEALWRSRLRWRMRGAWQWPTFGAALVVDTLLFARLPVAGDRGPGLVPAFLLAGVLNLVVVAVGAPLAGAWLRRRRRTMPKVVADDRAGTALLVAVAGVLVLLGLAHRPAVSAERDAVAAQARAARRVVLAQAPPGYRANIGRMDTWKQGPGLYRTCVPGPDPRRDFCVLVTTDQDPPGVTRDPDQRPNATVAGPDNPGRQPG
jgi:hypothetical protein